MLAAKQFFSFAVSNVLVYHWGMRNPILSCPRWLPAVVAALLSWNPVPTAAEVPGPDALAIRGVLPWHNFLSGPTAWNEDDYSRYLDRMRDLGLNYLAFHCYTGGAERYAPYVEPLIRIEYRNVVPQASLDTSLTARWGYRPLAPADFFFGTGQALGLPPGAPAFGALCAIQAKDNEDRYRQAQGLMRKVVAQAHERGIAVGMGFEFGIHPPEFASVVPPDSWIRGAMLPDPTHPASIEILHATLDNILTAYRDLDWVWLWLHEHTMYVGQPVLTAGFRKLMEKDTPYFKDAGAAETVFTGVWSLAYIREASAYLKQRAPKVRLAISGWGGGTQLPGILRGLNRALPKDVVFSCLNPDQGWSPNLAVMGEIAQDRPVWSIPWLEGDARLWHLQPRVNLLRDQVQMAQRQKHSGVLAIHWRTEEVRLNLDAFARFAGNPGAAPEVEAVYAGDCERQFGQAAAASVAPILVRLDRQQSLNAASPEFFPYDPGWGRLAPALRTQLAADLGVLQALQDPGATAGQRANLDWLAANFQGALLLDEVSRQLEPAYRLKERFLRGEVLDWAAESPAALQAWSAAPVEQLFRTFARRVRSQGERGELSALNQKVGLAWQELHQFLTAPPAASKTVDPWVVYEGAAGPGHGKHIVLVSGDEEYRSEESLPQLGKILAQRHGFKCTVLFAVDPDGTINPDNRRNIPGLENLRTADLMIIHTRFRELPDDQVRYIDEHINARKPVIGIRAAVVAFDLPPASKFARYGFRSREWEGGFGRQILGETWINHHGLHGKESSRGIIVQGQENHPVVRGCEDIWGPTDVYTIRMPLPGDSQPLLWGQVLSGMRPGDPPVAGPKNNPMMPLAWTRTYASPGSGSGRVFMSTMGAATDFESEGLRRLLVNATYWCLGLEAQMPARAQVDFVGEFKPRPFGFGGFKKGVKPADLR